MSYPSARVVIKFLVSAGTRMVTVEYLPVACLVGLPMRLFIARILVHSYEGLGLPLAYYVLVDIYEGRPVTVRTEGYDGYTTHFIYGCKYALVYLGWLCRPGRYIAP